MGSHCRNHHYHDQNYWLDDINDEGNYAYNPQTGYSYQYAADANTHTYLNGYSVPAGYQPRSESLYGDPLVAVCKENRANLYRLRETLTNVDPCYQFGPEHWHFTKTKPKPEPELPVNMRPKWKTPETMFASGPGMRTINWKSSPVEDIAPENTGPVNKFCYICTTLDEHKQHLARRGPQLKAKENVKPRVEFIVPLPGTRYKPPEVEEKKECLYKVTVKTGNKPAAATSAKVYIRLKGKAGAMRPQQLCKKTSVSFTFGRATKESFYIKTPILGKLLSLVISHDGLEKRHGWFLEEVEVCDVAAKQVYLFACRQWLSLHLADHSTRRELRAEAMEKFQREYLLSVTTGGKALAGTDAGVTLTLFGRLGSSSRLKLSRKVKDHKTLQRGATDKFNMVVDDIGPLERLRIEHDNKGRSPDWFLEKITVEDSERAYLFPCGKWIPNDEEEDQVKITLDLYPIKNMKAYFKTDREVATSMLDYLVTVLTGDVRCAGTDANVYLVLYGKRGKSRELQLDDEKNNFERGMVDQFKIKAEDIGDIKRIRIRHDNTSLAAGWFLDRVIIRRFFSEDEILIKMNANQQDMDEKSLSKKNKHRDMAEEGKKGKPKRSEHGAKYGSKQGSGDDSESPSDSDDPKRGTRQKSKDRSRHDRFGSGSRSRRKGRETASESDSESDGRNKKRKDKGRKGKKKLSYGGIDTWVTDSEESESDSEGDYKSSRKSKGNKSSGRKGRKYDTDDDENKRFRTLKKKDKKKKGKYDTSSESDSDDKKGGKFKRLYNKDKYDTASDSDDKRRKKISSSKKSHSRGKYATESESDADSDSEVKHKKVSKKSHNKTDKGSYSKSSKEKSSRSKSRGKDKFQETDSESNSDSDSYSESDSQKKKVVQKRRRRMGEESECDDDDNESVGIRYRGRLYERWREDRIPFCDEYLFVSRQWLATDEGDKQIYKDLRPTSISNFYRKA